MNLVEVHLHTSGVRLDTLEVRPDTREVRLNTYEVRTHTYDVHLYVHWRRHTYVLIHSVTLEVGGVS